MFSKCRSLYGGFCALAPRLPYCQHLTSAWCVCVTPSDPVLVTFLLTKSTPYASFLHFPLVSFLLFQDPMQLACPLGTLQAVAACFLAIFFLCFLKKVEIIVESEGQYRGIFCTLQMFSLNGNILQKEDQNITMKLLTLTPSFDLIQCPPFYLRWCKFCTIYPCVSACTTTTVKILNVPNSARTQGCPFLAARPSLLRPSCLATTDLSSAAKILSFQKCCVNGIVWYVTFGVAFCHSA